MQITRRVSRQIHEIRNSKASLHVGDHGSDTGDDDEDDYDDHHHHHARDDAGKDGHDDGFHDGDDGDHEDEGAVMMLMIMRRGPRRPHPARL